MDRRLTLKWMLAAAASLPLTKGSAAGHDGEAKMRAMPGYGTDPDLQEAYRPGELWPLSFDSHSKRIATALCDVIIPADDRSPGASEVGVADFIDEWISAPYPRHGKDRELILTGFEWLDRESRRRSGRSFARLDSAGRSAICDEICYLRGADSRYTRAARFFARYRDLTVGGFYTTPEGRKDLQYVGNVPRATFDGPPPELLESLGLR